MIRQLRGKITHLEDKYLILDVHGVGYKICTTPENLVARDENETFFWTHLVVKEDALDLYGFRTKKDLDFFEMLLTVSGIGPKSALGVLSVADAETIKKAVVSNNSEYLTKVAGIGRKNAEKIVLELKGKIASWQIDSGDESTMDHEEDVIEALKALGYSLRQARDAAQKIPKDITDTNARIKEALKNIA
jgi:Holliday junction DNA helicase RuvA